MHRRKTALKHVDQIVSDSLVKRNWAGVGGRKGFNLVLQVSSPGGSAMKSRNQNNTGAQVYSYQWELQADAQHL